MARNLDLSSLRSFVTVADVGGVTKAAGLLNLTQSAVSMQLKRLEESLGLGLIDRSGRGVALTATGEQLLSYARRMLHLNDEAYGRLTAQEFEGELRVGVPHDIVYPAIPSVLKRFSAVFPRMRVHLISAATRRLHHMFARGECDFILTTEDGPRPGGETVGTFPLIWIGARDGTAWRRTPLPVGFCTNCIFRPHVLATLNAAGVPWELVVDSEQDNAVEAAVSADLAVHALMAIDLPRDTVRIEHGGALPDLGVQQVVMYRQATMTGPAADAMADFVRAAYGAI